MRNLSEACDTILGGPTGGYPRIKLVSGDAVLVELGGTIDVAVHARVVGVDAAINGAEIRGIVETIPTYTSVLVRFDPTELTPDELSSDLVHFLSESLLATQPQRTWVIPVAYGGTFGPDLDYLCRLTSLSSTEIIKTHANAQYVVSMFGFLPGFAYLAGLPLELAAARRASPRDLVPSGSIAIGGPQTAIGSVEGPCGWHVIGRTPVRTFAPERTPATFLKIGDRVRLKQVEDEQFLSLQRQADTGAIVAECIL